MEEFINQQSTEMMTGEISDNILTPEERDLLNDSYELLTKLNILGSEIGKENLVVASQNLQDIIDTLC